MSMIRGKLYVDREVLPDKIDVGESVFLQTQDGKWVNREGQQQHPTVNKLSDFLQSSTQDNLQESTED